MNIVQKIAFTASLITTPLLKLSAQEPWLVIECERGKINRSDMTITNSDDENKTDHVIIDFYSNRLKITKRIGCEYHQDGVKICYDKTYKIDLTNDNNPHSYEEKAKEYASLIRIRAEGLCKTRTASFKILLVNPEEKIHQAGEDFRNVFKPVVRMP